MLEQLILLKRIPLNPDLSRLLLRVIAFATMFLKHGSEKVFLFGSTLQHYNDPQRTIDPLHLGTLPTLIIAMTSDSICSVLMVLGLATRWAALFSFCNLFVVWSLIDHFVTVKRGSLNPGEPVLLYITICLALFFSGAGKFSIDGLIERRAQEKNDAQREENSMARVRG